MSESQATAPPAFARRETDTTIMDTKRIEWLQGRYLATSEKTPAGRSRLHFASSDTEPEAFVYEFINYSTRGEGLRDMQDFPSFAIGGLLFYHIVNEAVIMASPLRALLSSRSTEDLSDWQFVSITPAAVAGQTELEVDEVAQPQPKKKHRIRAYCKYRGRMKPRIAYDPQAEDEHDS